MEITAHTSSARLLSKVERPRLTNPRSSNSTDGPPNDESVDVLRASADDGPDLEEGNRSEQGVLCGVNAEQLAEGQEERCLRGGDVSSQ